MLLGEGRGAALLVVFACHARCDATGRQGAGRCAASPVLVIWSRAQLPAFHCQLVCRVVLTAQAWRANSPLPPPVLHHRLTQPAAEAFAARCSSVDRAYVANFGEEVVRSQPVFMLRWVGACDMVHAEVGACDRVAGQ